MLTLGALGEPDILKMQQPLQPIEALYIIYWKLNYYTLISEHAYKLNDK